MSDEISIGDLVQKIARIMDVDVTVVTDQERIRPEKSEVERLFCDNKKILDNTSWKPLYNLDSGLRETVSWIEKNLHYFKTDIYNV